ISLFDQIDRFLTAHRLTFKVLVPVQNGAARAFLFAQGDVLSEETVDAGQNIQVRLSEKNAGQFEEQFKLNLTEVTSEEATVLSA
ncbi:MAG: GTPase HflX, partial [Pseudomonadota bacterium]